VPVPLVAPNVGSCTPAQVVQTAILLVAVLVHDGWGRKVILWLSEEGQSDSLGERDGPATTVVAFLLKRVEQSSVLVDANRTFLLANPVTDSSMSRYFVQIGRASCREGV